jgi:hypothetical protein
MSLEEKKEEIDPLEEFVQQLYREDPAFCEEYFNRMEVEGPLYSPEALEESLKPEIIEEIRRTGKIPSSIKPIPGS